MRRIYNRFSLFVIQIKKIKHFVTKTRFLLLDLPFSREGSPLLGVVDLVAQVADLKLGNCNYGILNLYSTGSTVFHC